MQMHAYTQVSQMIAGQLALFKDIICVRQFVHARLRENQLLHRRGCFAPPRAPTTRAKARREAPAESRAAQISTHAHAQNGATEDGAGVEDVPVDELPYRLVRFAQEDSRCAETHSIQFTHWLFAPR